MNISDLLIKDSYDYVLQVDKTTGIVYRIGGDIPVNPIFSSGITVNGAFVLKNGTEAAGKMLISDDNGVGTWVPAFGTSGSSGANGAGGALGYYGSFFDNTTQTSNGGNIINTMSFSQTYEAHGVSILGGANSRISIINPGTYNIQFTARFVYTGLAPTVVNIWLSKNGVAVPNTNSDFTIEEDAYGSGGRLVSSWNYIITTTSSNDYLEINWLASDENLSLEAIAENIPLELPATPSTSLTVQQIMYTQSGTSGTSATSGRSGSSGISGTSGSSATSGISGSSGSSATSGSSGHDGSSGTSGLGGSSGTSGLGGSSGTSGVGLPGSSGTSGMGIAGSSGTSGVGLPGTSGIDGSSGTSGVGLPGTSGIDGTSGTSGVGLPGDPGSSGTSGANGTSGTNSPGSYLETAFVAATGVTVTHNFGARPNVMVTLTSGSDEIVFTPYSITHKSINQFIVTFSTARTGHIQTTIGSPPLPQYTLAVSNYDATPNDYLIKAITPDSLITLPTATGYAGKSVLIKNLSGGDIYIGTVDGQTIDYTLSSVIADETKLEVISDGDNWLVK